MSQIKWLYFVFPLYIFGIQREPFLPAPYTFEFKNSYVYQYVPSIDQAINPIDFRSHNNFYYCSLSGSFSEGHAMFLEIGANSSSLSSFNFLQATFEYRIALQNELIGDALSMQFAPVISIVPAYRVKDVNTPYQNIFNASAILSVGKEFDCNGDWVSQVFAAMQAGISSAAGPFINVNAEIKAKFAQYYILKVGLDELVGFTGKSIVNVADFNGWSNIYHQSLKLNAAFSYIVGVYGQLELLYGYRLYAKSYYENDSNFQISYTYPFSP